MELDNKAVTVHVNLTSEETNNNFEIIEVKSQKRKHQVTYYLLVETKLKSRTWSFQGTSTTSASIKVKATYLYGSHGGFQPGQFISEMGGELNDSNRSVRLTNGSVMVDNGMRGLHVGTYLFHKIVFWAKQFDPSYRVVPISVTSSDAEGENKDRRNKLYTNSGIRFIWSGPVGMGGQSDPTLTISDLSPYANWPNITRNHDMSALDKTWQEVSTLKVKERELRVAKRYHRRKYDTIKARLHTIAGCLNLLGYLLFLGLGLIIGKVMGWYQGF